MNEAVCLRRDGPDHVLVTMPGGTDGDACREVEIAIAVHIPNVTAGGAIHDQGISLGGRRGDVPAAAAQEGASPRTRRGDADV
jgi:hypothetical protein